MNIFSTVRLRNDPLLGQWQGEPEFLRDHAAVYLFIAAICLIIALRYLRRALIPIGPLVRVVAAVAVVALAIGAALVLLTAAALSGGR
jgi:hypothetical protein